VHGFALFVDGSRLVSSGIEEVVTLWDLTGRHGKGAPRAEELLAAWSSLDTLDGARGVPAVETLVAAGAKSLPVIAAGMEDLAATQLKIAKWATDLGAEDFADRETASRELRALGIRAMPTLYATIARTDSPEAKRRATELVDQLRGRGIRVPAHGLAGDTLRLFRAVAVLEKIGGDQARKLLEKIAASDDAAGAEAKAALRRR
jgi:hypothetical protein